MSNKIRLMEYISKHIFLNHEYNFIYYSGAFDTWVILISFHFREYSLKAHSAYFGTNVVIF